MELLFGVFPMTFVLSHYTICKKKVAKSAAFKNYTPPSMPFFSELKILNLEDRFHLKLPIFVYESVHLISPTFLHNFFETLSSVHQYHTRQAHKVDALMTHNNTFQYGIRAIRYAGAEPWNDIPSSIVHSTSVMILQWDLKLHIFSTKD